MRLFKIAFFLMTIFITSICMADESTYSLLIKGRECAENPINQLIDCEYKIGSDFWLLIPGIGAPDTAVTFMKTNFNGKYYGSFGLLHGCVIVKPGRSNASGLLTDMAFVSPKNGKIYQSWPECQQGY